jgi:hypothetical protein
MIGHELFTPQAVMLLLRLDASNSTNHKTKAGSAQVWFGFGFDEVRTPREMTFACIRSSPSRALIPLGWSPSARHTPQVPNPFKQYHAHHWRHETNRPPALRQALRPVSCTLAETQEADISNRRRYQAAWKKFHSDVTPL